jgi:polyferredoxin
VSTTPATPVPSKVPFKPRRAAPFAPHRGGLRTLRRVRVIVAAIVFLLALAAFIDFNNLVPTPLKHAVASAQFVPSAHTFAAGFALSSLACVAILAITLAFGRVYCSVLCPLGILQDIVSRASALIRRAPPCKLPHSKPHDILRHGILAVTILAIATGLGGIALAWLDPYSNFGRVTTTLLRPLAIFANNIAATIASALGRPDDIPQVPLTWAAPGALLPPLAILVAIVITATLRGRLWCNTICPVGTTLGLVSRRSLWRLTIDKNSCRKCGDCLRACKAQCIDLRAGAIDHSRCVACYDCVSVCDEHGIRYRWHGLAAEDRSQKTEARSQKTEARDRKSEIREQETEAGGQKAEVGERKTAGGEPKTPAPLPPATNRRAFIATAATAALAAAGAAARLATRAGAQPASAAASGNATPSSNSPATASSPATPSHNSTATLNPAALDPDAPAAVAPPGARSTSRLLAQCTACQLCISACPSRVLEPAVLEYGSFAGLMKPRLNYERSFCNFNCTECSDACPDGTLAPLTLAQKQLTRIGIAHVTLARCIIVNKGTKCGACAEHCPTAALQIAQAPGHPDPVPVLDPRYCIGCGGCAFACPATPKAIAVHGLAVHETAGKLVQEKVKPPTTDDFAF